MPGVTGFLFLLAIDWPDMRTVTNEKRNGIQWTLWSLQEDEQPSIDAGKIN